MKTSNRHKMVDGLVCKQCSAVFSAREQRVKAGLGIFCSTKCASLWNATQTGKKYVGKENGKTSFDKTKQNYYVYWFDPETLQRKTTSYARWYWEVYNGEIPEGYRASYKNGNSLDINPENIVLISPEEFGNAISERLMGHSFSAETLQKMSDAKKGKSLSESHKEKIGRRTKERWEEGAFDTSEIRASYIAQGKSTKGSRRTDEQKKKLSEIHTLRYEKEGEKEKVSIATKKTWENPVIRDKRLAGIRQHNTSEENRAKLSKRFKGRVFSDEHLKNLSVAGKKRTDLKGEKSRWWRGGVANDPYPDEFSPYLKRKIRRRDKYICQTCGMNTYGSKTGHVHHVDGDKQNCSEENLLLLCATCHNAVHGRNNVTNDKIEELKGYLK